MEFYDYDNEGILKRLSKIAVMVAVAVTLAVYIVYGYGCVVENIGLSMSPTMETGEKALLNRISYKLGSPKRDDIIVFTDNKGNVNIKRILGLPGETVSISGGQLMIDGETLPGEIVSLAGLAQSPITLEEDEYFVLGDNREASEDSRFDSIGNIKREDIIGKLWLRYYPVIRLGYIG